MENPLLQMQGLRFGYGPQPVVNLPALELQAGQTCALIGPSGCGKSTLLHLVAGLLRPQAGTVRIAGQALSELRGAALDRFRGRHLGIVLQRLHLLGALSVLDNLLLAQRLARVATDVGAARRALAELGVADRADAKPAQLSRGQAQRVAIARALVHAPVLLLADEPTSSLDDANAGKVLDLLLARARAHGAGLLLVTHDQRVRGRLDREVDLGPRP
ncbi:ABC transporter ATP-binding protein [Panacagrimonas sp.]|uniref:ABC transporter ATP-binding protein n=1 Tax=Panacagrimonas sp. TaxID=2480088 RepID=UPI003B51903B